MSTRHFCTYFDHRYLPRAIVMLESLRAQAPNARVHVLCLSDECLEAMRRLAYPFVSLIALKDLEAADSELLACRPTRSIVEYYFTLTPCLPWHLLNKNEDIGEITYLDADMMFFSSPESIFEEAGGADVIITPHRFSSHLTHLVKYGIYNVSWLSFRNTTPGLKALKWYRQSCIEWCFDRLEGDRFADQRYLDVFPSKFENVHIMRHPGGGVAPWNLADADIGLTAGRVTAGGRPLVFYHAHNFKKIWGPFFSSGLEEYSTRLDKNMIEYIFNPYGRALKKNTGRARGLVGDNSMNSLRNHASQSFSTRRRAVRKAYKNKTLVFIW